jgi:hypothetical protein
MIDVVKTLLKQIGTIRPKNVVLLLIDGESARFVCLTEDFRVKVASHTGGPRFFLSDSFYGATTKASLHVSCTG